MDLAEMEMAEALTLPFSWLCISFVRRDTVFLMMLLLLGVCGAGRTGPNGGQVNAVLVEGNAARTARAVLSKGESILLN